MICRVCGKKETGYLHNSKAYQNNFCSECWATTGAKMVCRIYIEIANDLAVKLNQEFEKIEKEYKREKRDSSL